MKSKKTSEEKILVIAIPLLIIAVILYLIITEHGSLDTTGKIEQEAMRGKARDSLDVEVVQRRIRPAAA